MTAQARTFSGFAPGPVPLDVERVRADFPILRQTVKGKPLVYLDNAATTQKPTAVIDAISAYYEEYNSNVHRGIHTLSERATAVYESARNAIQHFLGAAHREEIVFVRGTTEGINLVAQAFARPRLRDGDEVLITGMEHHSDIVPWQLVCGKTGARLRVVPVLDNGELDLERYERLLTERTRIVGVVHVSNALGTVNPVKAMITLAHERGVPVLVDGAQAVPHLAVDVVDLDADFYAFSGHKTYCPTGIGGLYGKLAHLEAMEPYQGGGDMIRRVTFEGTEFAAPPYKFEAGTPHIEGAVGLGAGLGYLRALGLEVVGAHERALLAYATEQVEALRGVHIIGNAREKAGVLSFVIDGVHPHDVGTILDSEGIAVRAGHHCAQPVMDRFGVPATVRASFALYNTFSEVDALVTGIRRVQEVFG